MGATPQITLTATLDDISGAAAGSTANPARLRIALCNYGASLPRIAGTANIAKVGPFDFFSTGAALSVELWGNDAITPAGTYYSVTILDGEENVVQTGSYQFTGTQSIDLSSATPYAPPLYPATTIPVLAVQFQPAAPQPAQVANAVYTAPGAVIAVYYNGLAQRTGIDWIAVNATQFQLTFPTSANETVYVLCVIASTDPQMDLGYGACTPAAPQATGAAYTAPGEVVTVFYNGIAQRPGVDFTLVTIETFTLNFPTYEGDTVYALYSVF